MISLSCVPYLTRYYVKLLVTVFLFKCEIQPLLLPLAYKFSRHLKDTIISGTSWTYCRVLPRRVLWVFAQLIHLLPRVAGLQGGPELVQLCGSSQRVRPATDFEENRPLSQLFILKFTQDFLQLTLSKPSVLMGRFMFWGESRLLALVDL